MRKIAKSTQEKFNKGIEALMEKFGATKKENYYSFDRSTWELDTQAGKLTVSLSEDHEHCFSLFARFDDPKRANEVLGKDFGHNIYSGKWNFHLSDVPAKQLHEIFDFIEINYKRILI